MTFGDDHCWVILSFSKKEPVGKGWAYIGTTTLAWRFSGRSRIWVFNLLTLGLKKPNNWTKNLP
jgi:hypothetical protein